MDPSLAPADRPGRLRDRTRRRLGVLAAAAAVLAAPAMAAGPAVAAPAPPSPGHGHGHAPRVVVLDNGDTGTTVDVARGTLVAVVLAPTSERFAWSAPTSDTATVARRLLSTTRPDGGALAVFLVTGPGTANLQAVSSCRPSTTPCTMLGILWRATVHST